MLITLPAKANQYWTYWQNQGKKDAIAALLLSLLLIGLGVIVNFGIQPLHWAWIMITSSMVCLYFSVKLLRPYWNNITELTEEEFNEKVLHVRSAQWGISFSIAASISAVYILFMLQQLEALQGCNIPQRAKEIASMVNPLTKQKKGIEKEVKVEEKNTSTLADMGIIPLPPKKAFKVEVSTDLSPAAPEDLKEGQVRAYIARYSNVAVSEMNKFGIPASITMAQAIIESRSGTSILAVKNNNHFGIKCFSKTCPPGHCSNHTDDSHKDFFVKFESVWASFRAHSNFLQKNGYANAAKKGTTYKVWAKVLRERGYATDSNYDKKLIAIIARYELDRLDSL